MHKNKQVQLWKGSNEDYNRDMSQILLFYIYKTKSGKYFNDYLSK